MAATVAGFDQMPSRRKRSVWWSTGLQFVNAWGSYASKDLIRSSVGAWSFLALVDQIFNSIELRIWRWFDYVFIWIVMYASGRVSLSIRRILAWDSQPFRKSEKPDTAHSLIKFLYYYIIYRLFHTHIGRKFRLLLVFTIYVHCLIT